MADTPTNDQVVIDEIESQTLLVPIIGTMPLISHKFSDKAKRIMLDKMQGRAQTKTIRDPQADYEASLYRLGDGYGYPTTGFKAATIGAARFYGKSISMTELRQFIFFHGEFSKEEGQSLVVIHGEPRMREDYVRLSVSSTDLRYRAEFPEWTAELKVTFVSSSLSNGSLLSLIDAGGLGGVGEWRPAGKKSSGEFGTYKIDQTRDVEVL